MAKFVEYRNGIVTAINEAIMRHNDSVTKKYWESLREKEPKTFERWRERIETSLIQECKEESLMYVMGRTYRHSPVKMAAEILQKRGLDHITGEQISEVIRNNHYKQWSMFNQFTAPRVEPEAVYSDLVREYGIACKTCGRIEKAKEYRNAIFLSDNKKWIESGLCPVCVGTISAAKYKAEKEQRLAEEQYQEQLREEKMKLASDWMEQKQKQEQEKIKREEEKKKRRLLEKAAYKALEEMGILNILETKEINDAKSKSGSHGSKAPIVGKIQPTGAAKKYNRRKSSRIGSRSIRNNVGGRSERKGLSVATL